MKFLNYSNITISSSIYSILVQASQRPRESKRRGWRWKQERATKANQDEDVDVMATTAVSSEHWHWRTSTELEPEIPAGKSVGGDHRDAGKRRRARERTVSVAPPLHSLPLIRLAQPPRLLRSVVQCFPQALASPVKDTCGLWFSPGDEPRVYVQGPT